MDHRRPVARCTKPPKARTSSIGRREFDGLSMRISWIELIRKNRLAMVAKLVVLVASPKLQLGLTGERKEFVRYVSHSAVIVPLFLDLKGLQDELFPDESLDSGRRLGLSGEPQIRFFQFGRA